MIDATRTYLTREGGAVQVLATGSPDPCTLTPVVAWIETRRYGWLLAQFTTSGRYEFADRSRRCDFDLVLAPELERADPVDLELAPSYRSVCALCGRGDGHTSATCPWALTVVHGDASCA